MIKKQDDNFFQKLENTKPYFKAGFEGFAGTGKTHTAGLVAVGLHQKIKSKKPVIIFDTEKAAKFLKPMFAKAKIEVLVRESRSLADLKEVMKRMREGAGDVLIIDSISHVWENLLEAYKQQKNRTMLQFQDWGVLKPAWKTQFSDPFVNDPYHIIMCGRAGYEYENEINEDTGKREIYKSGVKMKVEGETNYEPDLLVLMNRFEEVIGKDKKVWREATILKDRSTVLDGKTIKNPTFADFEPAVDVMMSNPSHYQATPEANAADLVKTEEEKMEWLKSKHITLEKIESLLAKAFPGQSADAKKGKLEACEKAFKMDNLSWTAVENLSLKSLQEGYANLSEIITSKVEGIKEEIKK